MDFSTLPSDPAEFYSKLLQDLNVLAAQQGE